MHLTISCDEAGSQVRQVDKMPMSADIIVQACMHTPVMVRKPLSDSTSNSWLLFSIGSSISDSSIALLVEPTERILLATSPSCDVSQLLSLNASCASRCQTHVSQLLRGQEETLVPK